MSTAEAIDIALGAMRAHWTPEKIRAVADSFGPGDLVQRAYRALLGTPFVRDGRYGIAAAADPALKAAVRAAAQADWDAALASRLPLSGAEDRLAEAQEGLSAVQAQLDEAVQDRDLHRQQALSSCDSMLEAFDAGQVRESRICELEATITRLRPLADAEQRRQDAAAQKRSRAAKAAAAKRRRAAAPAKKARLEQRYQELLSQASAELAEGRIHDAVHGALARRLGVTRSWVPIWSERSSDEPREEYQSGRHTTPAGKTVHHPSAYGYRTIYHCAVREIHVGKAWLKRNLRSLCREAAAHR